MLEMHSEKSCYSILKSYILLSTSNTYFFSFSDIPEGFPLTQKVSKWTKTNKLFKATSAACLYFNLKKECQKTA